MYKEISKNAKLGKSLGISLAMEDMIEANRREIESQKDRPSNEDNLHRLEQIDLGRKLFLECQEISHEELRALGYYVPIGYNIEKRKEHATKSSEQDKIHKRGR